MNDATARELRDRVKATAWGLVLYGASFRGPAQLEASRAGWPLVESSGLVGAIPHRRRRQEWLQWVAYTRALSFSDAGERRCDRTGCPGAVGWPEGRTWYRGPGPATREPYEELEA